MIPKKLNKLFYTGLAALVISNCAISTPDENNQTLGTKRSHRSIDIALNPSRTHIGIKLTGISEEELRTGYMLKAMIDYESNEPDRIKVLNNAYGLMEVYNARNLRDIPIGELEKGIIISPTSPEEKCEIIKDFYGASIDLGLNQENNLVYMDLKLRNADCIASEMNDTPIQRNYIPLGNFPKYLIDRV